ncbi:tetratricopeptide repeat protein [Nocardioides sp. CFH 31398]|uniref:tetratricopeptide repeat protein n=1 Tax=Nocardioides sp. CFH 31398 TaxID=2919579 RepID=UPI001F060F2C|nr:tetratricopeptide repeat protein [Nocardioides sp. CFH 31398]MCH1866804.1 tetratricopeptide repeat protein [Nocardioides sp. CFH 31398]
MTDLDRVWFLLDRGRPQEALTTTGRLLASAPEDPDLHVAAAWALEDLGRLDESLVATTAALALAPEDLSALVLRGHVLLRTDRPAEAEEVLRTALRRRPHDVSALLTLSHALLAQERHDEAWKVVARARSLAPEDPDVHVEAGVVALWHRDEDPAACFERALALDPHHTRARHELLQLRPGSLREQAGTLSDLLRAEPQDVEYRRSVQDWADKTARRALLGAVLAWSVAALVGTGGLAAAVVTLLWWRRLQRDVPVGVRREARRLVPRTAYLVVVWLTTSATAVLAVALSIVPDPHGLAGALLPWFLVPWLLAPVWGLLRWMGGPVWVTTRLRRSLFS